MPNQPKKSGKLGKPKNQTPEDPKTGRPRGEPNRKAKPPKKRPPKYL